MINIILIEEHALVRKGIKMLLHTDSTFNILGEVATSDEALEVLEQRGEADLLISDYLIKDAESLSFLEIVKSKYPKLKVVYLSSIEDEYIVSKAIKNGASGYLTKNVSSFELFFCLNFVATGAHYISSNLSIKSLFSRKHDLPRTIPIAFSSRELEVLNLIAEGYTNMEISDKIFLSKRTVEGHRQQLLKKTGAKNTACLIKKAVEQRLLG